MNFNLDNLITAVSTVGASATSGLLAWLATRNSDRIAALELDNARLRSAKKAVLEQVESYHVQEGLMAAELEALGYGSAKQAKTVFRDRVYEAGFVRPSMTQLDARKAIDELMAASAVGKK